MKLKYWAHDKVFIYFKLNVVYKSCIVGYISLAFEHWN